MKLADIPPPVKAGVPDTLTVYYVDGSQIEVAYYDKHAAEAFTNNQTGVSNWTVTEYNHKG
jgi:hypothetical protein